MCLPVAALAAVGIAGGVLSGVGAYGSAMNNAKSYDMAAAGISRDIAAEKEVSAYEIARTRETVQRTLGSQRAGFAANGIALSGSALEVMNDTATEGDLDLAAIRWNSQVKVDSLKYEQAGLRANARDARASAPIAFLTPVLGGVARFGGSFG